LRHAQMNLYDFDVAAQRGGQPPRYWTVLGCPECGGLTTIETAPPQQLPGTVIRVFPAGDSELLDVQYLPDDVAAYFGDAIRVLRAGVPDAAAVELRRTLEAAARHFDVTVSPLVRAVEELIDRGLITRPFGDVLDHIRAVGNIGAHATDERLDDLTVQRALSFTAQVLRNLFEIPAQLDQLATENGVGTP
jgi:Domain of unknown function (DUF4145)